jgi:hypothetical protein
VELGLTEKEREVQGSCTPTDYASKQTAISSCFGPGIHMAAKDSKKTLKKSVEGSQ